MQKIQVITGLGYIRDTSGNVVSRMELPTGEHPLEDGYTYIEVNTRPELDAIQIFIDPAQQQINQNKKLIADKIRKTAIDALIAEGKLPAGYE